MAWTDYQQHRLAAERHVLAQQFPDFEFCNPAGETTLEGRWTSSLSTQYFIVVKIPPGYPDECPSTYITWPSPLAGLEKPLESYGSTHEMHLWETDIPGWAKICTYNPTRWRSSETLERVLHKALLWIEAYEGHIQTGRPIAAFLRASP